jgi:hypothetical protein
MKRWILENIGLKALAVLIAVLLWAYVGTRQVLERRVTLHLELTDVPEGMTVDPNVRSSVSVLFTGRKDSVLDLDPNDLKAVISLRGTPASTLDTFVHPAVRVQPELPDVSVTVPSMTVHLLPIPKKEAKKKRKS